LSKALAFLLLLGIAGTTGACDREERDYRAEPPINRDAGPVLMGELRAGPDAPAKEGARRFTENAYHIAEGKRLFTWFNCVGCHAHGGGGMGPPLMDDRWIYGSDPENIHATIVEGRPNGMPSFGGRIPDQQVWQLAAYVRSLGGLASKAASPGRSDHLTPHAPELELPDQEPVSSTVPPAVEGTQP
jgi:cytochrome c oxidase cbb3-type subunit III